MYMHWKVEAYLTWKVIPILTLQKRVNDAKGTFNLIDPKSQKHCPDKNAFCEAVSRLLVA